MKTICPGSAILITKKSRIIYQKCSGFADLARKIPITPKTNFRLASLSKPFTAMAISQLNLKLDSNINRYYPDFPSWGKLVTLKQLITHTAGFPDHEQTLYQTIKPGYLPYICDVLAIFKKSQPIFKPGSHYQYSDAGYVMLALIIEKVSGQKYSQFLKEKIFTPLGMKTTQVVDNPNVKIPNRSLGYLKDENSWTLYDFDPLNYVVGDEGIYSNLNDLAKLKLTNPLGWFTPKINGQTGFYHDAFWLGFKNFLLYLPDQNINIIYLSNNSLLNCDQKRWQMAKKLLKMIR